MIQALATNRRRKYRDVAQTSFSSSFSLCLFARSRVLMQNAVVFFLVFLSGLSALLFETLWLRLSGLAFGNSVWSAALILSSFMTGLAIGSSIAVRWKVRRRPLLVYATLELVIALFGCALIALLPHVGVWLRPLFHALWDKQPILSGLRLLLSFALLLVPTTAMGLTLPILVSDPTMRRERFSRAIGLLYGFNTLGAVVGALAAETYLVRGFGIWGTGLIAGAISCLAATLAWTISRVPSAHPAIPAGSLDERAQAAPACVWTLGVVSFWTGALFLILEIVWFRFLQLYLASSPTAFALMLATVLLGIGLGGVAAGLWRYSAEQAMGIVTCLLLVIAFVTLGSYVCFPVLHSRAGEAFYLDRWKEIVPLCLTLMLPTAFLSGVILPTLTLMMKSALAERTSSVGAIMLANTVGAGIGPLLASFILLPRIGFQATLVAAAVAYALLGLLLSDRAAWSGFRLRSITLWAIGLAVALMLVLFPYHRNEQHFARSRIAYEAGQVCHLVRLVEGSSETYQLLRTDFLGQPFFYQLLTNSFSMSATNPHGQSYMRLFAYLPLTLRPEAQDALLICYGCGVTADALTQDPQLKRIDVVDIAREVLALAPLYKVPGYSSPLRDPRVQTVVQDGRFFLQASSRKYDVITGEPPPPKVAGAVNLYTEEFFRLMRDRLNDGGLATFWLPIYQLKADETKAILRAFHHAFPNASLWSGPDDEWIMLGINGPTPALKKADTERLWSLPRAGRDLRRIGLEVPLQMAALFLMDGPEIERLTDSIPPLTDQYPRRLSDAHTDPESTTAFALPYLQSASAARRFSTSPFSQVWPEASRKALEGLFLVRETRYISSQGGTNWLAELDFYLRHTRLRVPVLEVLGSNEFRVEVARTVSKKNQAIPSDAVAELVADALGRRDISEAIRLIELLRANGGADARNELLLIYLYCLHGNVSKAETLAAAIPKDQYATSFWRKLQAEYGFRPPGG